MAVLQLGRNPCEQNKVLQVQKKSVRLTSHIDLQRFTNCCNERFVTEIVLKTCSNAVSQEHENEFGEQAASYLVYLQTGVVFPFFRSERSCILQGHHPEKKITFQMLYTRTNEQITDKRGTLEILFSIRISKIYNIYDFLVT